MPIFKRVREFHSKYERFLIPIFLILGFLFDYFLFAEIEVSVSFAWLAGYWIIAALAIVFMALYDTGRVSEKYRYARVVAFLLAQFMFGGLLKGVLVFYWFSAAFGTSWPFIILIIFLALFFDVFRNFFAKPEVQLSLYFFITFLLVEVMLPFLLNSISAWLFVIASIASLVIFSLYLCGIFYLREFSYRQKITIFVSMIVATAVMNALYFMNVIPPIPLAIRDAYVVEAEPQTFWQKLLFNPVVRETLNEKIYVRTIIFAPKGLNTTIVHDWQHYDFAAKQWVDMGKLPFDIIGGRQQGYIGYSWMSNLAAGNWRVYVQNQRGQVLGKVPFTIETVVR